MDNSRAGRPRPPILLEGMSYSVKNITIYWSCGHVSDHGWEGSPSYCPFCAPNSMRLITSTYIQEEANLCSS